MNYIRVSTRQQYIYKCSSLHLTLSHYKIKSWYPSIKITLSLRDIRCVVHSFKIYKHTWKFIIKQIYNNRCWCLGVYVYTISTYICVCIGHMKLNKFKVKPFYRKICERVNVLFDINYTIMITPAITQNC